MATAARSPLTGRIVHSVPAEVLGLIDGPVLLVGPRVPADVEIGCPTLVVCVDPRDVGDTAVPVITAWTNTFRSAQPRIAEVFSTVASPANNAAAADPSQAQRYATLLGAEGVTASATRLVGADPDVWLQDFADQITEPIFVATSVRWTDGQRHLHSTTQRLVRRSFGPVLVVPGRRSRTAEGEDERREDGQPLRIPGDDRTSSPHHASHEPPTTGEGSDPGDRFAVEDVTPESCWELLRSMSVGRLATYASGRPHIVPVNFVVDGRTIVFRTAEGAKLSA
ncbi:MAG: pyridoxamine 5'-phosphate oxidase family protein, partial [Acidimicrobiia bacterium]|nr:pyridoxamine 5'-phosphate oxidase family protein [Acidimicrobiia bacterium]